MVPLRYHVLALSAVACSFAAQLTDPTSKDNSPDCQCYFVSGSDSGFFQYHRFFDFRSVSASGDDFTTAPAVVTSGQDSGADPVTSSFFDGASWTQDWAITRDVERNGSTYHIVNSPRNVFISRNTSDGANKSTFLTLRTVRLPDWQSTAEITSKQNNILHGSLRARFRLVPNGLSNASAPSVGGSPVEHAATGSRAAKPLDDGAVAGFFTYLNDTQETDIEILTTEPTRYVHYTNQPDYVAKTDTVVDGASTNASLPDSTTVTDWIEHRIDWFGGLTRWYVDGKLVLEKTKNVPDSPSALVLNLWSDGGSWSGRMAVGGQVTMAIEYIQMVFNVSGDLRTAGGKQDSRVDVAHLVARDDDKLCTAACNVDGVQKVGFPEKAASPAGTATGPSGSASPQGTSVGVSTASTGASPAATSKSAAPATALRSTGLPGMLLLLMFALPAIVCTLAVS